MPTGVTFHVWPSKMVDGPSILDCIKIALKTANYAKLAIAYIGKNGHKLIGLDEIEPSKRSQYCDLDSGACNPYELEDIITKLKFPVSSVTCH